MLLTLYRSLTRHRLYAILNIDGLALGIVPLASVHLAAGAVWTVVTVIGTVGTVTLLLGVQLNNLATWRAGLRAREIALRKVVGATVKPWSFSCSVRR